MFSGFITLTLAGRLIKALETAGPNLFFIKCFGSGMGACFAISEGWGERSAENPPAPAQGSSTSARAARAAVSERLWLTSWHGMNYHPQPQPSSNHPASEMCRRGRHTASRSSAGWQSIPKMLFLVLARTEQSCSPCIILSCLHGVLPRGLNRFNSNSLSTHTLMLGVMQHASRVQTFLRPSQPHSQT